MTPIYDVVSAQPSVDAHEIRLNQMKLAMAVGENRHYTVHTVVGRHFVQTGNLCGLPSKMVRAVIEETGDQGKGQIDDTISALPNNFPAALADSVANAAKGRLEQLSTQ